jgi:hypothetical protein
MAPLTYTPVHRYNVGGLVGQTEFAFLNMTLLKGFVADSNAFHYARHRTGLPTKRFDWVPGAPLSARTPHIAPTQTTVAA